MAKLFISHSSQDDAFVRELRQALGYFYREVWVDSLELRGGDPLWEEVKKGIQEASAYAVVVSTDALQSKWVGKELRHALDVQKQRGKDKFPVFPLSLNGAKLGVMEEFFEDEPIYIPVSSGAGGIDAAIDPILVALGERLPHDVSSTSQPKAEPLEELRLELSDVKFHEQDGLRRASGRARLVYEPGTPGQPDVKSTQSWRFVAPLGPIEADELRWYLEKFAIWPSDYFRDRARRIEASLVKWGQLLYKESLPFAHTANVMTAWGRIAGSAGRRFSVYVDVELEAGTPAGEVTAAREAGTLLLGLPWELLHDGYGFLFQGAKPTRVRRRLPNTRDLKIPIVAAPIHILLVSPRPEDEVCSYIDHRTSALPMVEAMEELGGLVQIKVLSPPTLPALNDELDRAKRFRQPYHIIHFDGHGVYDRTVGLGALCFEDPQDVSRLEQRRHVTVFTTELGPLLQHHRIPVVFLEACQSAKAEKASESVASQLLQSGVASVVAMSHSVLVETSRRFVEAFYDRLAVGGRVGDAMLEGQRKLKVDTFRGSIFGVGELRLEDWFVPVLFQEKEDPQLFRMMPGIQTRQDLRTALAARLGKLPPQPETGFIGRSRELLALQRLLRHERYAVVRGQAGEGKTALAVEFARWMVRSQQIRRAAFVSVEINSNPTALLDAIGRQLVPRFSVATFDNIEKAIQTVGRTLAEQPTLLVVDNVESILLPPYLETPETLTQDARQELDAILQLCVQIIAKGETRIVFTTREALPAPFDADRNRRELHQLAREDAVKLVERTLNQEAKGAGAAGDATNEAIEQLVDAVHCHARTLQLLGPALKSRGVEWTRASLGELMTEMERKFPGSRDKSVFASVELSLQRMSTVNRERIRALGLFYGAVDLHPLREIMHWEKGDVTALAQDLIGTGLAKCDFYDHLSLNPALCPYLRGRADATRNPELMARWVHVMSLYVKDLKSMQGQSAQKAEAAATLTRLELPNFFVLLDQVERAGDAGATIALTTSLFQLLLDSGKLRLVARLAAVRDAATKALGATWNHTSFQVLWTRIEEHLRNSRFRDALEGAQELLQHARDAGEKSYPGAAYDLAHACFVLARMLRVTGSTEQALSLLSEAHKRFEEDERVNPGGAAKNMLYLCTHERGDCLQDSGRLEKAAYAYNKAIRLASKAKDARAVAVGNLQLGAVQMRQGRYSDALQATGRALEQFTRLNEPKTVAACWHQIGLVHYGAKHPEQAEDAFRRSLVIKVRLGDVVGQSGTLTQLGMLYDEVLGQPEESVPLYRESADKFFELGDPAFEGHARNNLASVLRRLGRLDEARREVLRAIECHPHSGPVRKPWTSWAILAEIETDAGNLATAADAKQKAIAYYLAFRRDGGENHDVDGKICLEVTRYLLAGKSAAAATRLWEVGISPKFPGEMRLFLEALKAIAGGSRDRALAQTPELSYSEAAEILLLIETLESPRR